MDLMGKIHDIDDAEEMIVKLEVFIDNYHEIIEHPECWTLEQAAEMFCRAETELCCKSDEDAECWIEELQDYINEENARIAEYEREDELLAIRDYYRMVY